jgi:phosphoribosylaminoimidazolecarboxamide formyltransferase / IMP cyclohydrolase
MTEEKTKELTDGQRVIRRALLSVSDKTGLVEFARELHNFEVDLISTGGTANALRAAGLPVQDVSDVTGFPEMMDGRVKTLHPLVHGALLAARDNPEHIAACAAHNIKLIDLLVINLYPFEATVARGGATLNDAIEQIDIGGPAMIRSAAKNFRDVSVIVSPETYAEAMEEMRLNGGALSLKTRFDLAHRAFKHTAYYDATIFSYLSHQQMKDFSFYTPAGTTEESKEAVVNTFTFFAASNSTPRDAAFGIKNTGKLADRNELRFGKIIDLRYGENPHQLAALYGIEGEEEAGEESGVAHAEFISGKEMSFNNYVDADSAWQLVCDFDETVCAIIKHTNPAGVAVGASPVEAYTRALETDPVSAFGGIVSFNCKVDEAAARAVTGIFTELIIAPEYTEAAIETLRAKKNLRVLRPRAMKLADGLDYKRITGGLLVQTRDTQRLTRNALQIVTKRAPSEMEIKSMLFAWTVCKHTKSNAIVYARDGQTVGVGAGQMSRIDSVRIGAMRARVPLKNSVLASDAFFPFRDGIDEAARHGITAVIQPGGSVRDAEVIAAADEHNLAMMFTGIRHFKH